MDETKPLEIQKEAVKALAARYSLALTPIYDPALVNEGKLIRPGQRRRHVFDSDFGIRLIISKERCPNDSVSLHVSASLITESTLFEKLRKMTSKDRVVAEFTRQAEKLFRQISQDSRTMTRLASTSKMVIHWSIADKRTRNKEEPIQP
jgi:hypothetical protein